MENLILNEGDYSSSHQEAKFKMDRKPDFETESLKMWVPSDKEKERLNKKDPRVEYKGYTFRLIDFTAVRKKGIVVFAYKFNHENRMVMAYLDDSETEMKEAYGMLQEGAKSIGYKFRDAREAFEKILSEEDTVKSFINKAECSGHLKGGGRIYEYRRLSKAV